MKMLNIMFAMPALALALAMALAGCETDTGGANNASKSISITGITGLSGSAGVWVFAALPQGNAAPTNTALQYGNIMGGALSVDLVVAQDNTFNDGPAWTGSGEFYVALVPVQNNRFNYEAAFFFTNGGETPVKVAFNQASVTLEFSKFSGGADTDPGYSGKGPAYSVSIPSAEEEAQHLINMLNQYRWFVQNGYNIDPMYPNHPLINTLKQKTLTGAYLSSSEQAQVRQLVINELYNKNDYSRTYTAISNALPTANQQVPSFIYYREKWGFRMFDKYTITITLYNIGGSYDNNSGKITMLASTNENRASEEILRIILHETVHIGIEANIVQRYSLSQQLKERVVDQFTSRHFKNALPNYWFQSGGDTSIDVIFNSPDVLDHLPDRVVEFMRSRN